MRKYSVRAGLLATVLFGVTLVGPHAYAERDDRPPPPPRQPAPQPRQPAPPPPPSEILIPGGTFIMGSEEFDSEKPAHQATVATFVLDRTEVTVAAYNGCVNAGRCTQRTSVDLPGITEDVRTKASAYCNGGKDGRSNHPMNCVDWNDATAFCSWAGKRLPTETEWEYAARGAEGRKYPWGYSEPADQLCWKRSNGTCSVGSFPSGNTPQGLVDMAGNVWEWTASNYCPYPSKSCTNAALVYRGGSWSNDNAPYVRGALRSDYEPGFRSYLLGFRCAR